MCMSPLVQNHAPARTPGDCSQSFVRAGLRSAVQSRGGAGAEPPVQRSASQSLKPCAPRGGQRRRRVTEGRGRGDAGKTPLPSREAPQSRFLKHSLPAHTPIGPGGQRLGLGREGRSAGAGAPERPLWQGARGARTVGGQGGSLAKWRAGGRERRSERGRPPAPGAASPSPASRGPRPGPQAARGQLRGGQSGALPASPSSPPSGEKGGSAGKDGLLGRAESPAPVYGSDRPHHRPREDERDQQTFLFGLWAQPGSHDRRHPAPRARVGASPTPIADAGSAFSQPHDPLRPPARSV